MIGLRPVLAGSWWLVRRPGLLVPAGAALVLVLVLVWVVAVAVVAARAPQTPVLGVGLETLALGLLGLGIGTALRAWHDLHQPAHAATLALVLLTVVLASAPRWYALHQTQTWGPPWEAAQLRWWGLALMAAGLVALALHDPVRTARGRRGQQVGALVPTVGS